MLGCVKSVQNVCGLALEEIGVDKAQDLVVIDQIKYLNVQLCGCIFPNKISAPVVRVYGGIGPQTSKSAKMP